MKIDSGKILQIIQKEIESSFDDKKAVNIISQAMKADNDVYNAFIVGILKDVYKLTYSPSSLSNNPAKLKANIKMIHAYYKNHKKNIGELLEKTYNSIEMAMANIDQKSLATHKSNGFESFEKQVLDSTNNDSLIYKDNLTQKSEASGLVKNSVDKHYQKFVKAIKQYEGQYKSKGIISGIEKDIANRYITTKNNVSQRIQNMITLSSAAIMYIPKAELSAYAEKQVAKITELANQAIATIMASGSTLFLEYLHLASENLVNNLKITPYVGTEENNLAITLSLIAEETGSGFKYGKAFEFGTKPHKNISKRKAKRRAKRSGDKYEPKAGSLVSSIINWIDSKRALGIWGEDYDGNDEIRDDFEIAHAIARKLRAEGNPNSSETYGRPQKAKPNDMGMIEFILQKIIDETKEYLRKADNFMEQLQNQKLTVKELQQHDGELQDINNQLFNKAMTYFDYNIREREAKEDLKKYKFTKSFDHNARKEVATSVNNVVKLIKKSSNNNAMVKKIITQGKQVRRANVPNKPKTFLNEYTKFFEMVADALNN